MSNFSSPWSRGKYIDKSFGTRKNEKKNARRGRTMKYSLGEGLGIEGDQDGGSYKLGIKLGTESGQK